MKEAAHLVRVALLFVGAMALFLVVRHVVVPKTFGQYGHFRGSALAEIRARPISFAGRSTCEMCHEEQLTLLRGGKHAGVGCEACHGPQAKHADDPSGFKPILPDTKILCARCHEANAAKAAKFPQVVVKEHSGGEACNGCHVPHKPKIG
ncbi:MAG: cytochrome c3 family protein [Paludibaculum sp.]